MSHYGDAWEKLNEYQIKRECEAAKNRELLINTLTTDDMIKIMFKDFIRKKPNYEISELAEEYLK